MDDSLTIGLAISQKEKAEKAQKRAAALSERNYIQRKTSEEKTRQIAKADPETRRKEKID